MPSLLPTDTGGAPATYKRRSPCPADLADCGQGLEPNQLCSSSAGSCAGGSRPSLLQRPYDTQTKVQLLRVMSEAGRTLQAQEDRRIVPVMFDGDAADDRVVVDVPKANGYVRNIAGAPPL